MAEAVDFTTEENPLRGVAFADVQVPTNFDAFRIKGACGDAFKEVIRCNAARKDNPKIECQEMDRHLIECLHWNPEWPSKG